MEGVVVPTVVEDAPPRAVGREQPIPSNGAGLCANSLQILRTESAVRAVGIDYEAHDGEYVPVSVDQLIKG